MQQKFFYKYLLQKIKGIMIFRIDKQELQAAPTKKFPTTTPIPNFDF